MTLNAITTNNWQEMNFRLRTDKKINNNNFARQIPLMWHCSSVPPPPPSFSFSSNEKCIKTKRSPSHFDYIIQIKYLFSILFDEIPFIFNHFRGISNNPARPSIYYCVCSPAIFFRVFTFPIWFWRISFLFCHREWFSVQNIVKSKWCHNGFYLNTSFCSH